jgi:AAA+ superfamily predicted ATPase
LDELIRFEKARNVLAAAWGFTTAHYECCCNVVLIHGPFGTGKTLTAEAVCYELGRPLQLISCQEMLGLRGASAVNVRGASAVNTLFKDARTAGDHLIFIFITNQ